MGAYMSSWLWQPYSPWQLLQCKELTEVMGSEVGVWHFSSWDGICQQQWPYYVVCQAKLGNVAYIFWCYDADEEQLVYLTEMETDEADSAGLDGVQTLSDLVAFCRAHPDSY